jgi:hypothetical protein
LSVEASSIDSAGGFEGAAFEGKARFGGALLIGNVGLQRRNDRR